MSPEAVRWIGLAAGIVFTSAMIVVVRPHKGVLLLTLAPSATFALADLVIEYAAFEHNIWICQGGPQLLHVPVVMLASFFVNGMGFCLVIYVLVRYRRGLRLKIDIAVFVSALGLVLYLLEFVWRDFGVTSFMQPYTHWAVLAAWQALLWVLVAGFLYSLHRHLGLDNVKTRNEVVAESRAKGVNRK